MFFRMTPEKAAARLLEEARMSELAHAASAEHHAALARMYRERVARLERVVRESAPALPHRKEPL